MKQFYPILFIFFFAICSLSASGQDSITQPLKPVKIWVYSNDNTVLEGILIGASDSVLFIYEGTIEAYNRQSSQKTIDIPYKNILTIKIKKKGGVIKGILIGGAIGFVPVLFGQGGGYVAIFSFPAGLITGGIIGGTSKKKYEINGDIEKFTQFKQKWE